MRDLSGIAAEARGFWDWWRSELLAAVPQRWRTAIAAKRPTSLITLEPARTTIHMQADGEAQLLVDERALGSLDDAAWNTIHEAVATCRATLLLQSPDVFTAEVSLPPQSGVALRQTLDLQLERLSPLAPDAIKWSYRIVSASRHALLIRIAMVSRTKLDALERQFAARSTPFPAIAADSPDGPIQLQTGYDGSRPTTYRADRRLHLAALAVMVSLPLTASTGLALAKAVVEAQADELEDEAGIRLRAAARLRSAENDFLALRALGSNMSAGTRIAGLAAALPAGAALRRLRIAADGRMTAEVQGTNIDALQAAFADNLPNARVAPGNTSSDAIIVEVAP